MSVTWSGQDKIFARKAHLQAGRQERQAAERFPVASREPSTSQEKVEASCGESDDMLMPTAMMMIHHQLKPVAVKVMMC